MIKCLKRKCKSGWIQDTGCWMIKINVCRINEQIVGWDEFDTYDIKGLNSCVLAQHSVTRTKNFSTRACPAPSTTCPTASSTRTHSCAGSHTCPANAGTCNLRGLTRPTQDSNMYASNTKLCWNHGHELFFSNHLKMGQGRLDMQPWHLIHG